jgi:hypothetical protein
VVTIAEIRNLPQDFPEYINKDTKIDRIEKIPSVDRLLLGISDMQAEIFEQFCWWLLKKSQDIQGCQRLGGGRQDGIDLYAFDFNEPDRLIVYVQPIFG